MAFTATPSYCPLTFTYNIADITNLSGKSAITQKSSTTNDSDDDQTFQFYYDTDLGPVGETQTVTVTATSTSIYVPKQTLKTANTSFDTTFLNPCINPAYVTIKAPTLLNQVYELYEFDPIGFQFTHSAFTIETVPIVHTLCGTVSYSSTFDGNDITDTSQPVGYHASNRTHDVYSESLALIDTTDGQNLKPYTVTAYLTSYTTVTSSQASGIIEFLDPCPSPESVTAPAQTNPADYYYTASSPKMAFVASGYTVEPSICTIVYSCVLTSSPIGTDTDLCALTDGNTSGVFDPITGNYDFSSIDMANYLPGDYTFTITGTVGDKSVAKTFTVTFVDPCPTTVLTLNSPFVDKSYTLRDVQIDQKWDIDAILTRATAVDCGPVTVAIFNAAAPASPIDDIMDDIRVVANDFNFAVLYSEDVTKKG